VNVTAGVMVLSAVAVRRMMVFSGVASQCEERDMGNERFLVRRDELRDRRHHRPGRDDFREAELRIDCSSCCHAAALLHSNWVPSIQIQWRMTAILRASAILAFLEPIRLASLVPQLFKLDPRRTTFSSTLAASNR
jgi:hypothetical protein